MKRLSATALLILCLGAGFYFSLPFLFNKMAEHLLLQDPLQKADLIVVLGGDNNGERIQEGVMLYKNGFARELLISGGPIAQNLTYADWTKGQAIEMGVPAGSILTQGRSFSTIDDARFSLPIIKQHHFRSVILVTSPYHCRRAGEVFRKIYSTEGIKVMVHPTSWSVFNPKNWWLRHEDTAFVAWEYMALLLYHLKGY